jgi:hypothetical protein
LLLMMQLQDEVAALTEDIAFWQTRAHEADAKLELLNGQLAGIQAGAESSLAEVMAMARDEAEQHAQTRAAKASSERTLADLRDELEVQSQAADDEKRLLRQVHLLASACPSLTRRE